MEVLYCQSCGMPMADASLFGLNLDGTKNEDYCKYCFVDGKFIKNLTMEEMIETCVPFMVEKGLSEENARTQLNAFLPNLKRWKA